MGLFLSRLLVNRQEVEKLDTTQNNKQLAIESFPVDFWSDWEDNKLSAAQWHELLTVMDTPYTITATDEENHNKYYRIRSSLQNTDKAFLINSLLNGQKLTLRVKESQFETTEEEAPIRSEEMNMLLNKHNLSCVIDVKTTLQFCVATVQIGVDGFGEDRKGIRWDRYQLAYFEMPTVNNRPIDYLPPWMDMLQPKTSTMRRKF